MEAAAIQEDNKLPPQVRRFIDLIGVAETSKLLQQLGGMRMRWPKNIHPLMCVRSPLKRESLEALRREFGDAAVDLPKYEKILMAVRDAEIKQKLQQGATPVDLMPIYGLSEGHIRKIGRGERQ